MTQQIRYQQIRYKHFLWSDISQVSAHFGAHLILTVYQRCKKENEKEITTRNE